MDFEKFINKLTKDKQKIEGGHNTSEQKNTEKGRGMTRRDFLQKSALFGAGMLASPSLVAEAAGRKKEEEENKNIEGEDFEIKRQSETIKGINDTSKLELESVAQDGEYYPSFKSEGIFNKKERKSDKVEGGFDEDLKIMNRFGTFMDKPKKEEIYSLLAEYDDNIEDKQEEVLKYISQDKYTFSALKQFLQDGGEVKYGGGHYDPESLEIKYGAGDYKNSDESIAYHELLHYIFDKKDSVLSESETTGGADHRAIYPLEDRFNIVSKISQGEMPISEQISGLYGYTSKGKAGEIIQAFIEANKLNSLKEDYLPSQAFFKNYVHSSMEAPLSIRESEINKRNIRTELSNGSNLEIREDYTREEEDTINKIDHGENHGVFINVDIKNIDNLDMETLKEYVPKQDHDKVKELIQPYQEDENLGRGYILTQEQLHDISYLNAMNAVILENSFILAIQFSQDKNISLEEAFQDSDYQKSFKQFLDKLTAIEQEEDNHFPIKKTGQKIREDIIGKKQ